jgi:pyruvate formate lyase activating enzyme
LNHTGKNIEIRIPYVPDFNDRQIEKIACFLAQLNSITKIRVLPYHNYAGSKYEALNIPSTLPKRLPTEEEIKKATETIKRITNFVVIY